jgi:uncharacterized membrane protein
MPCALSILTPVVNVQPGGEGIGSITIRNTGQVVDQYAINLLGDASAWGRPDPGVISLFPGAEETVTLRFSPPRSSAIVAGTVPFGVRVTSQEDPDFSVVEEGSVLIGGFSAVEARIVPRTSEGKRNAVHRLEITNTGNSPVTADVTASDPDELLAFDLEPDTIEVPPGQTSSVKVKVAAKKANRGKGARRMPFQVQVTAGGPQVNADAAFEQKPKSSVLLFLAILVVAGVLVYLLQDQAGALALGS